MAISYLSREAPITVQPFVAPVDFILQAAQIGQSRYDRILDATFRKENQLLNIDTEWASKEVTDKKNAMLEKMEQDLNSNIGLDLLNPQNIDKMESIFKPITQDKDIIQGISITQHVKSEGENFNKWKKDGKGLYDAKNEDYFWRKAKQNRDMTIAQVNEKGYKMPVATEYTDIDKLFRESVKDMHPDIMQTTFLDSNGNTRYIYTKKGTVLSQNDILDMLPMNSKIAGQAEINAYYDYAGVDKNQLLKNQRQNILDEKSDNEAVIGKVDKEIGFIKDNIKEIEANTDKGTKFVVANGGNKDAVLAELKASMKSYEDQKTLYKKVGEQYVQNQNDFDKIYGYNPSTNSFEKELDDESAQQLKTATWLGNRKNQFAKAWSYTETEFSAKPDEYGIEEMKHKFKLEEDEINDNRDFAHQQQLEILKAQLNPKKGSESDGSDGSSGSGSGDGEEAIVPISGTSVMNLVQPDDKNAYTSLYGKTLGSTMAKKEEVVKNALEIAKSTGRNLTREKLMAQFEDYNKVLKQFKELPASTTGSNLDKKMPNSEQTYRQYFDSDEVQDVAKFSDNYSQIAAQEKHDTEMLLQIQQKAKEKAMGEAKISTTPKNLVLLDDPFNAGYAAARTITVPKEFYNKVLTNTLTDEDCLKIAQVNIGRAPLNVANPVAAVKRIVQEGKFPEDNYTQYKKSFTKYSNELAKDYGTGYITTDYYIPNSVDKGPGKSLDLDAKKFVENNIVTKEKEDKPKDIEILRFTRDPNSASGWAVVYKAYTSTIDDKGKATQDAVKPEILALDNNFVVRSGLIQKMGVSFIQEALEQDYHGNASTEGKFNGQLPSFTYTYGGDTYKFIRMGDKQYRLMKKVGNEFIRQKGRFGEDISSVEQGLQLIQLENNIYAR